MKVLFAAAFVFLAAVAVLSAYGMATAQTENEAEFVFENDLNFEKTLNGCSSSSGQEKAFVQTGNPLVTGQAILLMESKNSDFEKLKSAFDFVSGEISYNINSEWKYASEVLEAKAGDCTDKSILLVSMLKNYGIESYVVTGKKVDGYSHAWVAAKIDGKWIQIDPTAGDLNFIYDCLKDENCTYHDNYEIESVFNEKEVLKCSS